MRFRGAGSVAVTVAISVAVLGCASSNEGPGWTYGPRASAFDTASSNGTGSAPPATSGTGTAPSDPSETADAAPSAGGETPAPGGPTAGAIEIRGFDLGFEPAALEVPAAGVYDVTFVNDGQAPHDVTFPNGTKLVAAGGETVSGQVEVPAAGFAFICSIPGHKEAGMTGQLTVAGSAAAPSGEPSGEDHGGPGPETEIEADLNAPAPVVLDPAAPDRLEGDVHEVDLEMTERLMTVAEGYQQAVWTFGDTVPGPVVRVKVGDTVRFNLTNRAENQLQHSMDFHSSRVAWNDEMTSINPGESKVYEWKAEYAGVYMYHCGTTPTLHHIANGMYGMVIVEPAEGLEPVEHEYALVQSEWYLGEQGQVTDLTKAAAAAADPEFVVFNGVASQYVDAPIEVPTRERVRVFVLNAGPNVDSSFHVVGTIFDRVVKEGIELKLGNEGDWGSQAMDLAPAQGGMVEFTLAEDGLYPLVTHAFNYVGRGALGLFQAGDGDPLN